MIFDILTLFCDSVSQVLGESIIGRAQKSGLVTVRCHNIRDYTTNRQNQVDDYPYGGGPGMILQADPLFRAHAAVCALVDSPVHTVLLSPKGRPFTQADARRLRDLGHVMLVCGHYEGVDERFIEECVDEQISLGDFVMTGGEIAAMAVADAVCRLVPGVLSEEEGFTSESHWDGLLEHPQYSRPELWRGRQVPPVLLTGNHAAIKAWQREQSLALTLSLRPNLLEGAALSPEDRLTLRRIRRQSEARAGPAPVKKEEANS